MQWLAKAHVVVQEAFAFSRLCFVHFLAPVDIPCLLSDHYVEAGILQNSQTISFLSFSALAASVSGVVSAEMMFTSSPSALIASSCDSEISSPSRVIFGPVNHFLASMK
jgi:hypothetical protein